MDDLDSSILSDEVSSEFCMVGIRSIEIVYRINKNCINAIQNPSKLFNRTHPYNKILSLFILGLLLKILS
jgi:hypothetical protein